MSTVSRGTRIEPRLSTSEHALQAVVTELHDDGLVEVRGLGPHREMLLCEVVVAAHGGPHLEPGARVLVSPPASDLEYGVIIGRVGRATRGAPARIDLEAGEEITLRCGKGSVTLRADGKVVVRGLDVVTTAERRNSVKGGSVEIN